LADIQPQLAEIMTGILLLATLTLEQLAVRGAGAIRHREGEFDVKNSQVAVLSGVILVGALLVAGSNWLLLRDLKPASAGVGPAASHRITVAMMPKNIGNAYFVACRRGAEEAAKELGVELLWDGPTTEGAAKQNEIIDTWITRGVDVIAVAVAD